MHLYETMNEVVYREINALRENLHLKRNAVREIFHSPSR